MKKRVTLTVDEPGLHDLKYYSSTLNVRVHKSLYEIIYHQN